MPHKVFLSSTFFDLAAHRHAVQLALRQLGAIDVSMENFGARDERPVDECIRLVKDESDLFVGIYAHRYGHVPEGFDVSISEMEYKAASDASLPRFIYIVDDNFPWLPAHIDGGHSAERLKAFKTSLLKRHICQNFGSHDHLAAKVVADVGRHIAMQQAKPVGRGVPVRDIGAVSLLRPAWEIPDEWNLRRNEIYNDQRNVFLAHVIRPTLKPNQKFDVFIYLIRHDSEDFSDIRHAEFFLGPYWDNEVFYSVEENGFIGISTSAYGTFLCLCCVTFFDDSKIYISRYIDFEMQRTGGV